MSDDREHGGRLSPDERRVASVPLYRTTGDRSHLAEAQRLLDAASDLVDPDLRDGFLGRVRVNREIVAASRKAGGSTE